MKNVCIVGLGYIGLPTALMFASHGVRVYGVDASKRVCDIINAGGIQIVETGLEEVARKVAKSGMFSADTQVKACENFIISVPTPITKDKKADLSYVVSAAEQIAPVLKKGNLVVLESTVSPRCTEDVLIPALEKSGLKAGVDFMVAHCPERVLPGRILYELQHNDRIIGGIDTESAKAARDLYAAFVKGNMFLTTATTAEMCKLMENTFRDVNIALANELAMLCDSLKVNVWEVVELANKHPRVNLHMPGPGVGGHCLAVDPWFIVESQPGTAKMIKLARETNDGMPGYVAGKIGEVVEPSSKVLLLGCTYKPNIDDMRESPIVHLFELLKEKGYAVDILDPFIEKYKGDIYEKAAGADLTVLCVNHSAFENIDLKKLAVSMNRKNLMDTRNFFDKEAAKAAGFAYYLLGDGREGN